MDVEKIYQMFILGTDNPLPAIECGLGGLIFFTKDIITSEQFKALIASYKSKAKLPMFYSIDQEGGRVERTEHIHSRYLSPKDAYNKGADFLLNQTIKIVEELTYYGINMNFAPCLDVNTNPNNPIIGDRAFSDKPEFVIDGYNIVSKAYKMANIVSVIKHFPGHGDASKDSHLEMPIIDLSLENMEKYHILPFKYAVKNGADAVMIGHLHCTCFDKDSIPATLSKNCINYIRHNLKFNGVLISDDMVMKGVEQFGMTEACLMGIRAGMNMFIYRYSTDDIYNLIEDIIHSAEKDIELRNSIDISYERIIKLKEKYGLTK